MMKLMLLAMAISAQSSPTSSDQAPMVLHYDKPATYFEESLPIGNGKIGALVYGGTDDNIIYLNDITLWTGKPVDRNLDADAHKWARCAPPARCRPSACPCPTRGWRAGCPP